MNQPVSTQSLAVLLLCTVGEQRWACSVAASCSVQHCVRDMVAPSLFCECLSTIAGDGGAGAGDGIYSYCRGEALQQAAAVQAGGPATAAAAARRGAEGGHAITSSSPSTMYSPPPPPTAAASPSTMYYYSPPQTQLQLWSLEVKSTTPTLHSTIIIRCRLPVESTM